MTVITSGLRKFGGLKTSLPTPEESFKGKFISKVFPNAVFLSPDV